MRAAELLLAVVLCATAIALPGVVGKTRGAARGGENTLWNTREPGLRRVLQRAQNLTASDADGRPPCLVFLLYSTSCPFSRTLYDDVEALSAQYGKRVAFVAMEKSHSSLNLLMQFGFHAVPQIVVYSPAGQEKLRGSNKTTALRNYLRNVEGKQREWKCDSKAFDGVLPAGEREPRPTEWRDGSQEMARVTWCIVGLLGLYYASVRLCGSFRKSHEE
ncbi:hypothetical protein HKI87_01g00570 [Chloropicon roscoffensis]|uniref:Thioredoxin domain-containing protein n=1 Tax=Chloropicon roscoffensis TaxID=1461544 RepID=A0AAX4NYA2_9CHLO